jgi:hypothetical protein
MSPEMQGQPLEARLAAPRQSLTWVLIALALLTAGALSLVAGVIHWWDPCFTAGFDSTGCIARQSDPSDLTGFTVLPSDLRKAAVMLAASNLVIGLLWFSLVLVGARSLAGRVVTSISGGAFLVAAAVSNLWWYAQGQVLLGNEQTMDSLFWFGLIVTMLAAGLMWRPGERRLDLLLLGLLAGSPLGFLVDYFFWMMIYSSYDTPPGAGLAQTAAYVVAGVGILYLTSGRSLRRVGADRRGSETPSTRDAPGRLA